MHYIDFGLGFWDSTAKSDVSQQEKTFEIEFLTTFAPGECDEVDPQSLLSTKNTINNSNTTILEAADDQRRWELFASGRVLEASWHSKVQAQALSSALLSNETSKSLAMIAFVNDKASYDQIMALEKKMQF